MKGCCFFPPIFYKSRSYRGSSRINSTSSFGSPKNGRNGSRRESTDGYGRGPVIVCFGEMMVNLVPTNGEVSISEAVSYKKSPAGATSHVAVAISRLGGSSAFIGKVGRDEFGFMLADILKRNGVDNSGLVFDANARTALSFHALKSDGHPQFLFYRHPSADMLLRPEELHLNLIHKGTIFHYSSGSLVNEPSKSTQLAAMKVAKMSGSILSYAPNLALPIWPSPQAAREAIISIWNFADIIKVNVEEIRFLTEGDDPYEDQVIMNKLYHNNLKLLLVTEGQKGCRYYTKEFNGRVCGFEVEAVDTNGAGDSFLGGFLCILVAHKQIHKDERRLREALEFANACGAATVTGRGAIPSLPTKDAVLRILLPFITQS